MEFTLLVNAYTINSQISGHHCKISVLQQLDMGLPNPKLDCSLNLNFAFKLTLDQVKEHNLTDMFRGGSLTKTSIPLKTSEDVEKIIPLAKLVSKWDSWLGGNWNGEIPYTEENFNAVMAYFDLPVPI